MGWAEVRPLLAPLFTLVCSATFCVVYLLDLPLYRAYSLMLTQMLSELALQPKMSKSMQLHHLANTVVTVLYLLWPTFDPIIRAGIVVEFATLILSCHNLINAAFQPRAPGAVVAALKLAFAIVFFYTRFFVGGIQLVDPIFVWEEAKAMPPTAIAIGFACLVCIHCCAIWWAGLVIVGFVKVGAKHVLRIAPFASLPMTAVAASTGSLPVVLLSCMLAALSVIIHKRRSVQHSAVPHYVRLCAGILLPMAMAIGRNNDQSQLNQSMVFVTAVAHAAVAICCIRGARSKYASPFSLAGCLVSVAILDAHLLGPPPRQPTTYFTILGVLGSALWDIRRQKLDAHAVTVMQLFGAALVYQGCQ